MLAVKSAYLYVLAMRNTTPFFQAFGPLLFGRAPKSPLAAVPGKIQSFSSLSELMSACGSFIPQTLLEPLSEGDHSRQRQYSLPVTFWAFLAQVLSPATSCREIVRRVQAWHASVDSGVELSSETGAYCMARAKVQEYTLAIIHRQLAERCERAVPCHALWRGRSVKIVDGTTVSMPDTDTNQKTYPQPSSQKAGCGFPLMRLVGLFSLASGALLDFAKDNLHVHESLLFRQLWKHLQKGDILLADRGFCSYFALSSLLAQGVDSLLRFNQTRKTDLRHGRRLGSNDRLQIWRKPAIRPKDISQEQFDNIPATLTVRLVKFDIAEKGFRTRSVTVVTTLLDPKDFPLVDLADLYLRRWGVELRFREIKITLAMDVLRCLSPHMIHLELLMHMIAYNVVRALMQEAADRHHVELARISFKGTLDTLRHWSKLIGSRRGMPRKQAQLIDEMLRIIASDQVPDRPNRSEPRAKKRRPKNYQLITRPRNKMGRLPHRNRPRKSPRSSSSRAALT